MSNIKDVAREANVSAPTVARVINNRPGVRQTKIDAIHAAMKKLGYVPPPVTVRRGPKTPAREGVYTKNIAYLLINMEDQLVGSLSSPRSMSKILSKLGMNLFYVPMPEADVLPELIKSTHVDGVVYQGDEPIGKALELLRKLPVVRMMTRHSGDIYFDCIAPDNGIMGEQAAEYLKQQGAEVASVVCAERFYNAFKQRIDSFVHRAEELNLPLLKLDCSGCFGEKETLPRLKFAGPVIHQLKQSFDQQQGRRLGIFYPSSHHNELFYHLNSLRNAADRENTVFLFGDTDEYTMWFEGKPAYFDARFEDINERTVEQLLWRMRNGNESAPINVYIPPKLFASGRTEVLSQKLKREWILPQVDNCFNNSVKTVDFNKKRSVP